MYVLVSAFRVARLMKKARRVVDDECAEAGEPATAVPMKQVGGETYTAVSTIPMEFQYVKPQAPLFLQPVSM